MPARNVSLVASRAEVARPVRAPFFPQAGHRCWLLVTVAEPLTLARAQPREAHDFFQAGRVGCGDHNALTPVGTKGTEVQFQGPPLLRRAIDQVALHFAIQPLELLAAKLRILLALGKVVGWGVGLEVERVVDPFIRPQTGHGHHCNPCARGGFAPTYGSVLATDTRTELPVRLLQLRDLARRDPARRANALLDADMLAIVAAQADQAPALMTTGARCQAVAQMGGYLALKARWSSRLENPQDRLASCPNAA
jgi:hypothetical protein